MSRRLSVGVTTRQIVPANPAPEPRPEPIPDRAQAFIDVECHTQQCLALLSIMMRSTLTTIHVPGPLRDYCGGASELSISASSVRAVLEELERRHPSLYRGICDETGAVRRHINLFVNTTNVRDREGLYTSLGPGDVVTILPAVSGG